MTIWVASEQKKISMQYRMRYQQHLRLVQGALCFAVDAACNDENWMNMVAYTILDLSLYARLLDKRYGMQLQYVPTKKYTQIKITLYDESSAVLNGTCRLEKKYEKKEWHVNGWKLYS